MATQVPSAIVAASASASLTPPTTPVPLTPPIIIPKELEALMDKVRAAKGASASEFEAAIQDVTQRMQAMLQPAQRSLLLPRPVPNKEGEPDFNLERLQRRYPSFSDVKAQAVAARSVLMKAEFGKIPETLASWGVAKGFVEAEMKVLEGDIRDMTLYLHESSDSYNWRRMLCTQLDSDANVLQYLPLVRDIQKLKKDIEALPLNIPRTEEEINRVKEAADRLEEKLNEFKKRLSTFLLLCELQHQIKTDDYYTYGHLVSHQTGNNQLLSEDRIDDESQQIWQKRKDKIKGYLIEMLESWHTYVPHLWHLQFQIDCYFLAKTCNEKLAGIKKDLDNLHCSVTALVNSQPVLLDIPTIQAHLFNEEKGLKFRLKTIKESRESFEHFLNFFEQKNQPLPVWLQGKTPYCLFISTHQEELILGNLNKLHAKIVGIFKSYHDPIMTQWREVAHIWNAIVLKMRQLQFFIDRYNRTFVAQGLIDHTASMLRDMQKNIATFESEQKVFFIEDVFNKKLEELETAFNTYASNKWNAQDLIDKCKCSTVEKMLEEEKVGYILYFSEEETFVTAELSKMLSGYRSTLESQKDALATTWDAMDAIGKEVGKALKEMTKVAAQGGYKDKGLFDGLKKSTFVNNWITRPQTPTPANQNIPASPLLPMTPISPE